MNYVEFFGGSYFLAWCSLWLFWMVVLLVGFVIKLCGRILRSINIAIRGWPPEHLDGDGDFIEMQESDQDEETSRTTTQQGDA